MTTGSTLLGVGKITLRALLADHGIGQRQAARVIDINERTMRRYCSTCNNIEPPLAIKMAIMYSLEKGFFEHGDDKWLGSPDLTGKTLSY